MIRSRLDNSCSLMKARVDHKCVHCNRQINIGEMYCREQNHRTPWWCLCIDCFNKDEEQYKKWNKEKNNKNFITGEIV